MHLTRKLMLEDSAIRLQLSGVVENLSIDSPLLYCRGAASRPSADLVLGSSWTHYPNRAFGHLSGVLSKRLGYYKDDPLIVLVDLDVPGNKPDEGVTPRVDDHTASAIRNATSCLSILLRDPPLETLFLERPERFVIVTVNQGSPTVQAKEGAGITRLIRARRRTYLQ
jgi:hypothetical protein